MDIEEGATQDGRWRLTTQVGHLTISTVRMSQPLGKRRWETAILLPDFGSLGTTYSSKVRSAKRDHREAVKTAQGGIALKLGTHDATDKGETFEERSLVLS
jgi:hypothetical protein